MKGYRTRTITLPGGRVIEIVYFADPEDDGKDAATPGGTAPIAPLAGEIEAADLHVCPTCDSELVYPVAWEEREGENWRIDRRCPNCEWRHVGEFHQSEVEQFDDELNDGTEDLLVTLRNFSRANMEADVERLIDAINLDLIHPMDF